MNSGYTFQTEYMGYACEWSPFDQCLLAVATAQNFGIAGKGKQCIFHFKGGMIKELAGFHTEDGVYDCTWSESVDSHVLFCMGDGSVKLWDWKANKLMLNLREHKRETYSVDWNLVNKENFISGSWDNTVKLWHPDESRSIRTYAEHTKCVYSTIWHPRNADMFASTSGDGTLKVWDAHGPKSVVTIAAHQGEVLTCDWNKYHEFQVVTGSVDKTIKSWDIRNPREPIRVLAGHDFAVRRLKCSPHSGRTVATASYDMTIGIWDMEAEDALIKRYEHHTEFALGVDFNLFVENLIASCSWDESIHIFNIQSALNKIPLKSTFPTSAPSLSSSSSSSSVQELKVPEL